MRMYRVRRNDVIEKNEFTSATLLVELVDGPRIDPAEARALGSTFPACRFE